jgi:hypothetical protein
VNSKSFSNDKRTVFETQTVTSYTEKFYLHSCKNKNKGWRRRSKVRRERGRRGEGEGGEEEEQG